MATRKPPAKPAAKKSGQRAAKKRISPVKARKPAPAAKAPTRPGSVTDAAAYERKKLQAAERERSGSRNVRDIGDIPPPEDPKRRESCREDFGRFCKTYFPGTFKHDWSEVHQRLISLISLVVLSGALLAIGIPRGWGKTSLCVRGVMWAMAYRHHVFCVLIAASNDAAKNLISDIRTELEENELLRADFPEFCLPIKNLEGINQRGKAQLCGGERTKVFASDYELRLGNVAGKSGAIVRAGGILSSRIRGARYVSEGAVIRPTLGLADDIQTEASAASKKGCYRRERILQGALPGLPGPGFAWSCLLTMTVIEPDDVADRVLNRDKHPDWHGVRHSALDGLPSDEAMEFWYEWNRIRERCLRDDEEIDEAHRYYKKHRREMNAGTKIVWKDGYDPERFVDPLEQSMDWFFRDRQGFWSELMNNPGGFEVETRPMLQRDAVAGRVHHLKQFACPQPAEFLTAFADVQGRVLFYEVRAHALDSTSWVIDYGTWPGQPRLYYTLNDLKLTLDSAYPKHPTFRARLAAAVKDLFGALFSREYKREDGQTLRMNVAAIDANFETEAVKAAILASGMSGRILPSHGRSFRPPKLPINDLPDKDGDRAGNGWRLRIPKANQQRHLLYDVDYWKSHHRDRLLMPPEAPGALTLFAGRQHEMWTDHTLAENSSLFMDMQSQRVVEMWELRPERPDNHFLDCSVGNHVLGGMLGCVLPDNTGLTQRRLRGRKKRPKRQAIGKLF
jgi:hypothetical protein